MTARLSFCQGFGKKKKLLTRGSSPEILPISRNWSNAQVDPFAAATRKQLHPTTQTPRDAPSKGEKVPN